MLEGHQIKQTIDSKLSEIDTSSIKLLDLFDVSELQKIQDVFAKATGVASIITDPEGTPITKASGFTCFCKDIIRKTEIGLTNCKRSDAFIGGYNKSGPSTLTCLSAGLIDGGASIMLGERHIGSWLIGQVLDEDTDLDSMMHYADEIGADPIAYKEALKKVKRMPREQFEAIADSLFLFANQLSKLATENIIQAKEIELRLEKEAIIIELNKELETKIAEKNQTEKELLKERLFTNAVLDNVPGLLYLYDEEGNLIRWNKQHEIMTGYTSDEMKNMKLVDWYKEDKESELRITNALKKVVEEGSASIEANLKIKNGSKIPFYLTAARIELDNQMYFIGNGIDISKQIISENENKYLSYYDVLTGLHNRRYYDEIISEFDIEDNLPITVLMGDVNGLKLINDAVSYNKGDQLLKTAADVVKEICDEKGLLVRWGGDEILVLLPRTTKEEAANIVNSIKENYVEAQSGNFTLTMTFGWQTKYHDKENLFKIIKSAEDTMFKNKVTEHQSKHGSVIATIIKTLHEKNPREEKHSQRVSEISQLIGQKVGLSKIDIARLKTVGLLHDIGKIAIEEGILNKAGRLTDKEYDSIKQHPDIGYRILSSSSDMGDIADLVIAHHERYDGKGYPNGLKGVEIPYLTRIITLADAYDAMVGNRTYKKPITKEDACKEIIKHAGTQFDPDLAKVFVESLGVVDN